jgi:hypothetical protein
VVAWDRRDHKAHLRAYRQHLRDERVAAEQAKRRAALKATKRAVKEQARQKRSRIEASAVDTVDWRAAKRPFGDSKAYGVRRNGALVKDARGKLGHPHKLHDTLAALARCGRIKKPEERAGRELQELLERGAKGTLAAAPLERLGDSRPGPGALPSQAAAVAMQKVGRALAAVGPPRCYSVRVTLLVLGEGLTLREAAALCHFLPDGKEGEQAAKWLLVGALDQLALHFGYRENSKKNLDRSTSSGA